MANTFTTTLVTEECFSCHVVFGMTEGMQKQRVKDHKTFWCPNGHGQIYVGETSEQRLERQLKYAQTNARLAQQREETANRRAAAYKGHLTHHKKQAAHGDCPVCSKHFERLKQHMTIKHPEYVAEAKAL